MQDLVNAFSWVFQNIHAFGWIFLIVLSWRASSRFTKFVSGLSKAEKSAEEGTSIVKTVATNHLPHLQEGIDRVNTNIHELRSELVSELKGVRSDLLQYALRKD